MNTNLSQIKSVKEIDSRAIEGDSAFSQNFLSRLIEFQVRDSLFGSPSQSK